MNLTNYETLLLSNPAEYVLQVTLNRQEVYNAMNTQMGVDLLDLMKEGLAGPSRLVALEPVLFIGIAAFVASGWFRYGR